MTTATAVNTIALPSDDLTRTRADIIVFMMTRTIGLGRTLAVPHNTGESTKQKAD